MTITRSAGIPVKVGALHAIVGGGYRGLTKELDDTVAQEAELLSALFNRDVEIRFNSDRESGGAWLKNSLEGLEANCQVGLNAGLRPIKPAGMSDEDFRIKSSLEFIRSQPKELYIETYVSASCLKDPSLAKHGTDNDPYCLVEHRSIGLAIVWLIDNIDMSKIYD
jgi:hypothetical protein